MDRITKADLFRYGGEVSLLKGLREAGFRYMYFLRKASKHKQNFPLAILYKFIVRRLGYKYGFQIPIPTQIGEGFFIGHFGTIVINEKAIIGNNCNIAHNTTIGQTNRGRLEGTPIIGNKVWIGTGSVIVGKIKIGNDVLIAPNTFVNMDVPDNSIVIGNPAKIIQRDNATEGYMTNVL